MRDDRLKNKLKEQAEQIKIKSFHLLNRKKGVTRGYAEMLVYQRLNEVMEDITLSKTTNDFYNKIATKIDRYSKLTLFHSVISGFLFGTFNGNTSIYFNELKSKMLFANNFNPHLTRRFVEQYKKIIYEYIRSDNKRSNSIIRGNNGLNNNFNIDLTEEHIYALLDQLFIDRSGFNLVQENNITTVLKIVLDMQILYPPNILFNNQDFVEFEMKSGYFDKYIEMIRPNSNIPTLQQRIEIYEVQKELNPEDITNLENLQLLEQRISRISPLYRDDLYSILKQAKLEPDNKKRMELIDECYSMYEIAFRKEIVDSIYSPTNSTEITDFKDLKNTLLHTFIRDSNKLLNGYDNKIKEDIINSRRDGNKSQTLTQEEQDLFNRKMAYAINIQANPVIVEETLDIDTSYTDSAGIRGYTSDTRNQISASFFSPKSLLNQGTCVGIGFDRNSLSPENIAISSPQYLTTNMGLNNIEVKDEYIFTLLSAPVSELEKSNKTEVVLFRKGIDTVTKASYVFAIISGLNYDRDLQALNEARRLAEENNLKLVVFNLPEIKKSLEEKNTQEITRMTFR